MVQNTRGKTSPIRSRSWTKTLLAASGAAIVLGGVLAACGAGSTAASNTPAPVVQTSGSAAGSGANGQGGNAAGQGGTGAGQGAFRPAASGLIAEVDPGSMEVQSTTAQTTVNWTSATTFTQTAKAALTDVKAGSCVSAIAEGTAGTTAAAGGTSAAAGGTAPAAPTATSRTRTQPKVTALTATIVTISPAVAGKCTAEGGFGVGGFAGGGFAGTRPSGAAPDAAPTDAAGPSGAARATGAAGFGGRGGEVLSGKVSKVSGSALTVVVTERADDSTYDSTVTVTAATTYSQTKSVSSAAAKVGLCASAIGTADTTGNVAAKSIALTSPTNGTCNAGFGRGGRGTGVGGNGAAGSGGGGAGGGNSGSTPTSTNG